MGEINDIVKKVMAGKSPVPQIPDDVKIGMAMMMIEKIQEKIESVTEENKKLKSDLEIRTKERDELRAENNKMRLQLP